MSRDAQTWFRKLRVGLNPVEKLIGGELAYRAEDDTHHAWPTRKRIADDTEVPVRTVARTLAALEAKGIITRVGTKETTNAVIWRLNVVVEIIAKLADPPNQNGTPPLGQNGTPPHANMADPPHANMAHTKLTIESNSQIEAYPHKPPLAEPPQAAPPALNGVRHVPKRTRYVPGEDPAFDEFWRRYPRKIEGPVAAKKAWDRAIGGGETSAAIINGVSRYPFDARDGGRYLPQATTWLNQYRWTTQADTLPIPVPGPRKTTPTYGSGY